jgi:serine/threonine-protein kinase
MGQVLEADGDASTNLNSHEQSRVLDILALTSGPMPRVHLPDTAGEDNSGPLVRTSSDEMPLPTDRPVRVQLLGEIARGGMGAILKGRDPDLGRDLAVKVLLEKHEMQPELVRRFVEEAQIGGQLQHPGIVPVYELGAFADRRPYFTMKLVKGRTLATLLADRPSPAEGLPRLLAIFEAVCQTVAYAHARRVIHRDLKPSNVMVGSFGEVQVMDWGLAKVLEEGGVADELSPEPDAPVSVIATVRRGSDGYASEAGSVLGTPAYMAPEQALGDVERVDERADVFGLGSILCEILTGEPAYTARGRSELIRMAMQGDTAGALARLEGCGADAELVSLAKDCLAPEPDDRAGDAGVVAGRVTAYLAGVQERLRATELARVAASARAEEEAKRRELSDQLAREAEARAEEARRREAVERQRRRYQLALAASALALTVVAALSYTYWSHERQARATRAELTLNEAIQQRDFAAALPEDLARLSAAARGIEAAGRALDQESEPEPAGRLAALRTEVHAGLAAALRDSALLEALADVRIHKQELGTDGANAAYARAFRAAGLDVDALPPEEIGSALKGRPASVAAAATAALDDWALSREEKRQAAAFRRLLEAARAVDPDSFRDRIRAAILESDAKTREGAMRTLAADTKAGELPPPSAVLLASALRSLKAVEPAIALLRAVVGRHPDDLWVNYELGIALTELGPAARDEAVRYFTAARSLRPEAAHQWAHLLDEIGRGDEALAIFADLAARRPRDERNLVCYGRCLQDRGSHEADAVLDRAVSLASVTIRNIPNFAGAHADLAYALSHQGKLEEAIAEYRLAIRLDPGLAEAHSNLGSALANREEVAEARAEYREAVRLKPDLAHAHYGLGIVLRHERKLADSVAEYRAAIGLKPYYAEAYCNLAGVLGQQGDYAGSLDMYRKGHELGSKRAGWRYPSAQWVADAERAQALVPRLPAVLRGEHRPSNTAEQRTFARMAYDRNRFSVAARLWAEALSGDPELADDRDAEHRFSAACAAALAASGQGDDPKPDEVTKSQLRSQALAWLKDELTTWDRSLDGGDPKARAPVVRALRHWKGDPDLAGVRDHDALAKLPKPEGAAWRRLWANVEALLKRVEGHTP